MREDVRANNFAHSVAAMIDQYFVKPELTEAKITAAEMQKDNGTFYGLRIESPDIRGVQAQIYLNKYYDNEKTMQDFMNDEDKTREILRDIAGEIEESYDEIIGRGGTLADEVRSIDKIRDRVVVRLINAERNQEYLKNVPYRLQDNLAAFLYVKVPTEDPEHSAGFAVTDSMVEYLEVDLNDLFEDAIRNMERESGPKIMNLMSAMMGDPVNDTEPLEPDELYVATTPDKFYGASAILLPSVQEKIERDLGGEVYVLPSSVHEVIIAPKFEGVSVEELRAMVRDINADVVSDNDFLSDDVYEIRGGELVIARDEPVLEKRSMKERLAEKHEIVAARKEEIAEPFQRKDKELSI